MVQRTKRQHYVPASFLSGFTGNLSKSDTYFVFDKKELEQRTTTPIAGPIKKYIYDYSDSSLPVDFVEQKLFAPLEGSFASIRNDIVNNQTVPSVGGDDYDIFIQFVTLLAIRTKIMKGVFQFLVEDLIENGFPPHFNQEVFEQRMRDFTDAGIKGHEHYSFEDLKQTVDAMREKKEHDWQNTYITQLLLAAEVQKKNFYNRKWTILLPQNADAEFISSDNPVGIFWARGFVLKGQYPGFETENSEIHLAIHKNMALRGSFEIPAGIEKLDNHGVALLNNRTLSNAERFVYSAKKDFFSMDDRFNVLNKIEDLTNYLRSVREGSQQ